MVVMVVVAVILFLRGNKNLWTLLHLRYYKNVHAEDGEGGSGNNSSGKSGKDVIIEVPLGTIARDEETGKLEVEILEDGQEVIWMKGGRGGSGQCKICDVYEPGAGSCTTGRRRVSKDGK